MEAQFFKHLMTRVAPQVTPVPGPDGQVVLRFAGDRAPILDYHLAGSWFTAERKAEIRKRFADVLKDPRLSKIVKTNPKFNFSVGNMVDGALLPGIIN